MSNKKYFVIIFFMFLSTFVLAEDSNEKNPLEEFVVLSKSVPSEIIMMVGHLKESTLNREQIETVFATAALINSDLQGVPMPNIMFLFKSEAYRGILTNQYLKQGNILQMSVGVLKSAKAKLKKHSVAYTNFSKWLIESFIKDFDPFLDKNFLNEYQNLKRSDYNGQLKVKRLNKVLKYHSSWLNVIDQYTPEEFNELCTKIIVDTFERISKKTYYFKTFYGKVEKSQDDILFSIPKYSPPKTESALQEDTKSLKEQAQERKKTAQKDVKNLDSDDLSGASEEIDKIEAKE